MVRTFLRAAHAQAAAASAVNEEFPPLSVELVFSASTATSLCFWTAKGNAARRCEKKNKAESQHHPHGRKYIARAVASADSLATAMFNSSPPRKFL
jgi:hypothetical protein